MTRDSAAVASLDDRRRRRCPVSAASSVADDGSSLITSSVATSGSSSNGGCDEGASSKSSSTVSTTTSCCGSSPSRTCSDDDDSAAVPRMVDDSCPVSENSTSLSSLHNHAIIYGNGDKDSLSSSNFNDKSAGTTSTNIGGRLTFYKDGKFIFQLAAHQQHTHKNQSATTSQCRWIPVPTVVQQHKNSIKRIGESSSQHYQNKTIWPYLITDHPTFDNKPLPMYQSQSISMGKSEDRLLHQLQLSQRRMTPPLLTPFSESVNLSGFNNSVVMATTTNVMRRLSRKYSTSASVQNVTDLQHQNRQPKSLQLRTLSKCSKYHQNQSFMMVATRAIKVLRRSKQRHSNPIRSAERTAIEKESLCPKTHYPSPVNLEHIVRHLWCRRHTTELLRRQISSNNNLETAISTSSSVASQRDCLDSSCPNVMLGGGKRRSLAFPLSNTTTIHNESTIISTALDNCNASSSPYKKYKLGSKQQRKSVVNKSVKITVPTVSANNHSITAILSGNVSGTKRGNGSVSTIIDPNNCFITNTSTSSSLPIIPQKNILTTQPSLLRTLLKSPNCENRLPSGVVSSNDSGNRTISSRTQSAVELITPVGASEVNNSNALKTPIALPSTLGINVTSDAAATHTTIQLPLHHPAAAEQLTAAAGYFNVLYHQAAMAAAMVYQNHSQMSQPLLKPTPLSKSQPSSLLSSQFPISDSVNNSWQQQLNRRPPILPLPEMTSGNAITAVISKSTSSVSTVVTPYSSPLNTNIVNGSGLVYAQEHQLQYQQQVPSVEQPYLYHKIKQQQLGGEVQGNVTGLMEYSRSANVTEKYLVNDDKESITSIDCMPLNLSKDSAVENIVR